MSFISTQAGGLRHPVVVESPARVADDYGGYTTAWTMFYRTRAAIWPLASKEYVVDGKLVTVSRFTIRMRYVPGVTTKMRVVNMVTDEVYQILGQRNIEERNKMIDLTCAKYV